MKCVICGKEIPEGKGKYLADDGKGSICSDECFHKEYWQARVDRGLDKEFAHIQVIIDNTVYQIGKEDSTSSFRGYDDRRFVIKFNDGTVITTTNLWYNGKVPDDFKDKLKDNAVFVKED